MNASFFGVVSMTSLENVWPSSEKNKKIEPESLLTENRIKIVHYSDCQQLIIWLPIDGISYQDMSISDLNSGNEIWRKEIRMIINGSIQIIIDTLPFAPGDLSIKINKKDGLQHIINLKKYPDGFYPEEPDKKPEISPDKESKPIVYKDGFGKVIPDEDLILREKIINKTINKITRRLEYVSQGRDGEVIYIEGEKRIKFLMEIGAYDCIFYINIPSTFQWETSTKFPLEERNDIIAFVAEQTHRDQAPSCKYKISETEITYFRK